MRPAKKSILVLWTTILVFSKGEEEFYEKSYDICGRCRCDDRDVETFIIDCTDKDWEHTLAEWPPYDVENVTTIKASFSGNHIRRLVSLPPTDVASLVVYFDHCNITELGQALFSNCPNITFVDLSHNLLKGDQMHSDVFMGPYNNTSFEPINLEQLDLSYNKIHTIEKNCFEHTPNLRWLNLEGNQFGVIDVTTELSFSNLRNLEYLNLARNKLVDIPDTTFKSTPNIRILDVSRNDLDFMPGSALLLKKLERLVVDGNPIIEFTDGTFLGMDSLMELSAKDLKSLIEIRTNSFAPLASLQRLDMSGMKLGHSIAPETFGNIRNLVELNFSGSNLRELPVDMLDWSKLQILDLNYNQFYCDCYWTNITKRLSEKIQRQRDGPFCYDIKTSMQYQIYELRDEDCQQDGSYYNKFFDRQVSTMSDMKILRMSLLMLSVILIVCLAVAMWLGYTKYINRNRSYPFASTVIYNPIQTNY